MIEPVGVKSKVVVVRRNKATGATRIVHEGTNRVFHAGCRYYAQRCAQETPTEFVDSAGDWNGIMVLSTNAAANTDSGNLQEDASDNGFDAVGPFVANLELPIDATYPKLNDTDTDNTGKGANVTTYRVTIADSDTTAATITAAVLASPDFDPDVFAAGSMMFSAALLNGGAVIDPPTATDDVIVYVNHSPV